METKTCLACGAVFGRKRNRARLDAWRNQKTCSLGCYHALRRQSGALIDRPSKDEITEFMSRAMPEPNTGCWIWTAPLSSKGYGWFRCNGIRHIAHRWAFTRFKGPIPDGMFACHTCDNRWCVNPDHLFSGTARDNMHDCIAKGRFRGRIKVSSGPAPY